MSTRARIAALAVLGALLGACGGATESARPDPAESEIPTGPHGGRLLVDGGFAVELAIFEAGVPPELRAWVTQDGRPVPPAEVDLEVRLRRFGDRIDSIGFRPRGEYLQGDAVVYEPHSFVVSVRAVHQGKTYAWEYESLEGRTRIDPGIAERFGLETEVAGPALLRETITAYGRIETNRERTREIRARFDGAIEKIGASVGDRVSEGHTLATVESNGSLVTYPLHAPIAGVITQRDANAGEQTAGRVLFTIDDLSSVWADLSIFPADRARVRAGAPIEIAVAPDDRVVEGEVAFVRRLAGPNQAVLARAVLDNPDGLLVPGSFVTGRITVHEEEVPLAVRRTALQSFRDFTVVYAQVGDEYEVRMLDLGRRDGEWVEVLGGLEPGTRYVTRNSYLIKADIEKSGASHDH